MTKIATPLADAFVADIHSAFPGQVKEIRFIYNGSGDDGWFDDYQIDLLGDDNQNMTGWWVDSIQKGMIQQWDGTPVKQGDKITPVEADMMLRMEVDRIAATLSKQVPHWGEMTDNQKSALISFAYNLGEHFYGAAGFTTITSALRDKRWDDVPRAMLLYRNPGSSFENGLKRRRKHRQHGPRLHRIEAARRARAHRFADHRPPASAAREDRGRQRGEEP